MSTPDITHHGTYTEEWQRRCVAAGGFPTRNPKTGAPACRIGEAVPFEYRDMRTWTEKMDDAVTQISEAIDMGEGRAAEAASDALEASGVTDGVTGLAGKALGIPHWMVVALLLVAGYAVGVQAGVFPKLGGR